MRPDSNLDAGRADFRMRLENRSRFVPREADFKNATWKPKSTLDCRVEQTLDATTIVDFVPRRVDF
jgi:hypothetical protein